MAWLRRGNRRYFYRSVRRNGRVQTDYLGSGSEAQVAAWMVLQRRQAEQQAREVRRAEQVAWDDVSLVLHNFVAATDKLARTALESAGYHEHRGEWRRKKMLKLIDRETGNSTIDEQTGQIVARAHQGDSAVLPQLQELLDERPDLWRWAGDLAAHARESLLGLASGNSLLVRESIRRKLDELAAGLGESTGSPLERLLIERVVLSWVQVHLADLDAIAHEQSASPRASHARQRQNAGQKRYLQAIKALASVRKMLSPVVRPVAPSARCLPEATTPRTCNRAFLAVTN